MVAHLSAFGLVHQSHQHRLLSMADLQYGVLDDVYTAYRRLMKASIGSRYYLRQFNAGEERELLELDLAVVTRFVGLS